MKTLTINLATINDEDLTTLARVNDGVTFNLAVACAYLSGQVSIPSYVDNEGNEHEGGKVAKANKLSYSKIANLVDYSKATVTAWINAIKKIVDEGVFEDFNDGTISFNADKINLLLDEDNADLLDYYGSLSEAMHYSFANLKKQLKKLEGNDNGEGEESDGEGDDANGEGEGSEDNGDGDEVVIISYNGDEYEVKKTDLEKLLVKATKIEKA